MGGTFRPVSFFLLSFFLLGFSCPLLPQAGDMGRAYARAERFGSPARNRLVYLAGIEPHWIGRSHRFWYLREVRGKRTFVLVDGDKGTKDPAFDHRRLARALSRALGRPVRADRLPFRFIWFGGEGKFLEFHAGGKGWRLDLEKHALSRAPVPAGRPAKRGRKRKRRPGGLSPDGRWRAYLKDFNLFVRPAGKGAPVRLSGNGAEENRYTAFRWSPDSKRIVAFRTVPGEDLKVYTLEVRPRDTVRPRLHEQSYALPGDKLPVHRIWIYRVPEGKGIPVKTDPVDWGGPPRLYWQPGGRHFFYVQTYRGYQRRTLVRVDSFTGEAEVIIDERSRTNLPPMKAYHAFLKGGKLVLWASERDGWNHLYLYEGETGRLVRQVTKGDWVVRKVQWVDEKRGEIWFSAGGMEPGRDPYFLHFYRVGLDGKGLVSLTPGNGTHQVSFSPDRTLYLDRWSRVDKAPVTELRRSRDGSLVLLLEEADLKDLPAAGRPRPEPFAAPGRDGKTPIYGVIWRPSNLDPEKKYPVVEDIYAGPQDSFVPKSFHASSSRQALAELGFVVVKIDGMGTSNRSKAFHDVSWKNLADSGFPDRIAWMKAAARTRPWMDLSRVGIYGVSAGGYNAARALIDHPEFYKVAVSAAGNHDHRTDKVWWNELWMGYPPGPWYKAQSNVECAGRLRGKLLLIHGLRDTNVNPFAATFQFVRALIREGKDFDLLVVPDAGHGMGGAYGKRRMWNFFVENLLHKEPPPGYPKGGGSPGLACDIAIRNLAKEPVEIYWLPPTGGRRRYTVLAPGATFRQHSYVGHRWIAVREGKIVARYTVAENHPEWVIR